MLGPRVVALVGAGLNVSTTERVEAVERVADTGVQGPRGSGASRPRASGVRRNRSLGGDGSRDGGSDDDLLGGSDGNMFDEGGGGRLDDGLGLGLGVGGDKVGLGLVTGPAGFNEIGSEASRVRTVARTTHSVLGTWT